MNSVLITSSAATDLLENKHLRDVSDGNCKIPSNTYLLMSECELPFVGL